MKDKKFQAWMPGRGMFQVEAINWRTKRAMLKGMEGALELKNMRLLEYATERDRDGAELYEEDVVELQYVNPDNRRETVTAKVIWQQAGWRLTFDHGEGDDRSTVVLPLHTIDDPKPYKRLGNALADDISR